MDIINQKIDKLKELLKGKKIAISYSGGADSTLLAFIAKDCCEEVLAITYDNGIMPEGFIEFAKNRCLEYGIKQKIIKNNFLNVDEIVANTSKRCYECRKLMYDAIKQIADENNYKIIMDGTNITDLFDDRPGILVNYQHDIQSPFIQVGLKSDEIHKYLEVNDIDYAKVTTCYATRIKTNEEVTLDKVNRVSYCEYVIKDVTKCEDIRLREENNVGTIEVSDLDSILDSEKIKIITEELELMKYSKVLLDIGNSKNKNFVNFDMNPIDHKIVFEFELPYNLDLDKTKENLEEYGKIRYLKDIEYINLELDNHENISIFKSGKIHGKNILNKNKADEILLKVLTSIRREIIE